MNLRKARQCERHLSFIYFIVFFCPVATGYVRYSGAKDKDFWPSEHPTKTTKPAFEDTETRIVAMAGRDVTLPCLVKNLNDKVVSWIRTKDLHILTSGPVKFTADDRFDWKHQPDSSDWSLRLTKSQVTDSGIYECQVNTDPKMNRKITLDIVSGFVPLRNSLYEDSDSSMTMVDDEGESPVRGETVTKILGKEEQFVKIGSTITFTCVIIIPGEPVSQVDWLKNGRQVSFQASRGGIIVSTEKSEGRATSRLILADVKPQDSGNYTCKPGNSKSHSIALVVIEGERTEAMQRHKNGALRRIPVTQVCLIGALYLVYNSVVF